MSSKRKIFVGSSKEAEPLAARVISQLVQNAGMNTELWNTSFPPSSYLLEVLEKNLPQQLTGAILLATPDVFSRRANATFNTPVANVVLEYAYLAARLGRKRVAICKFDDVSLPSDLEGLTYIKAGTFTMDRPKSLPEDTRKELRRWLESLPPLADQIPPIRQLHGYSGKWKVQANFSLWQNKPVKKGQVVFNGFTALCLHADGTTGFGMQNGILTVNLGDYRPRFDIFNEVEDASVDEEGELTLTIKVLHRELLERTKGTPARSDEDWLKKPKLAPSFQAHLRPDPKKSKSLQGFHEFTPSARFQQHATETWDYLDS